MSTNYWVNFDFSTYLDNTVNSVPSTLQIAAPVGFDRRFPLLFHYDAPAKRSNSEKLVLRSQKDFWIHSKSNLKRYERRCRQFIYFRIKIKEHFEYLILKVQMFDFIYFEYSRRFRMNDLKFLFSIFLIIWTKFPKKAVGIC